MGSIYNEIKKSSIFKALSFIFHTIERPSSSYPTQDFVSYIIWL